MFICGRPANKLFFWVQAVKNPRFQTVIPSTTVISNPHPVSRCTYAMETEMYIMFNRDPSRKVRDGANKWRAPCGRLQRRYTVVIRKVPRGTGPTSGRERMGRKREEDEEVSCNRGSVGAFVLSAEPAERCERALNRVAGAERRQHLAIRMKYRRG